jgi:hypothetical protein
MAGLLDLDPHMTGFDGGISAPTHYSGNQGYKQLRASAV